MRTPKMPNFEPTKWQLHFCKTCELNHNNSLYVEYQHWYEYGCQINQHEKRIQDNIPFFVPDMTITGLWYKGWARVKSNALHSSFMIGPSKFEELLKKTKINKGRIDGNWFMYCKLGTSFSLRLIK